MKFSKLKKIVTEYAERIKENAAYSGSHDDGGCAYILSKLKQYQDNLVNKLDLRPSEFDKLNDLEIGEPDDFRFIFVINDYKTKLAEQIIL